MRNLAFDRSRNSLAAAEKTALVLKKEVQNYDEENHHMKRNCENSVLHLNLVCRYDCIYFAIVHKAGGATVAIVPRKVFCEFRLCSGVKKLSLTLFLSIYNCRILYSDFKCTYSRAILETKYYPEQVPQNVHKPFCTNRSYDPLEWQHVQPS